MALCKAKDNLILYIMKVNIEHLSVQTILILHRKSNNKMQKRKQGDVQIWVITKLPNYEQSYKGKVKTHKYINRQNQSTTGKL